MAYNPRMSIIPSSQKRTRQKEEKDTFVLPEQELAGCITDMGIPCTVADLQKPNPVHVQTIYEGIANLCLNATRETIEPAMRAAANDICGEFADTVPADTRNLLGFYASLRKLLLVCGINDFSFNDLYKPTHGRLVKVLSYLINFIRFRESQAELMDELINNSEMAKNRIEALYQENQDMEERLAEMHHGRKKVEATVKDKTTRNEDLKQRLLELRRTQEKVAARLEEAKASKTELAQRLEQKTAEMLALKQDSAKLRPYVLQSPQALQTSLAELSNQLTGERAHIDALDRRARALQTSADSFAVVSAEVASCKRLMDEIEAELLKEEEEVARNAQQRDEVSKRGNNVREVQRLESRLKEQLATWNDKTEKVRQLSRQKAQEDKERMEELSAVHKKLSEERTEKGKDMERRRVRIEQTEKKMLDLKEQIENEVRAAYDEYVKLEAHVQLYITDMENLVCEPDNLSKRRATRA